MDTVKPMDHHSTAAEGSHGVSAIETLAANVQRLAETGEKLVADFRLLITELVKRSSQPSGLPPLAYSKEEAAKVSGMEVKTIDYLIKTRQLPYVKIGSQRGKVIRHDDLVSFMMNHRRQSVDEFLSKQG